jgi:general stress protein YciG
MTSKGAFDRVEHCRKIARSGGLALCQKRGKEHMATIGKKGFESTTQRYFGGKRDLHLAWLASVGVHTYWRNSGMNMKYDAQGYSVWPEHKPVHPARAGN